MARWYRLRVPWVRREIVIKYYLAMKVTETLVGRRVRVRAAKEEGSARLLDGLRGLVIAEHPIALNWVVIVLDRNARTDWLNWSIPADRLVLSEDADQIP